MVNIALELLVESLNGQDYFGTFQDETENKVCTYFYIVLFVSLNIQCSKCYEFDLVTTQCSEKHELPAHLN